MAAFLLDCNHLSVAIRKVGNTRPIRAHILVENGPTPEGGEGRRSRASGLRSARGALRSGANWSAATGGALGMVE